LAFSPERVDPGNPQFQTHNIPKVVAEFPRTRPTSRDALRQIVGQVFPVTSARVAERRKLWENTFRAINIGMANEMAKLCNALGIDTWEVVSAAATKPFGFMPFFPGPGIGGHCIPLDPHYLSWKARQHGFDSQFISLAEQVNSNMPAYVVELASTALNDARKAVNGSKILILGVAYKKDIDDMRESPALSIIDLLRADGADVYYHDPFVPEVTFDHAYTIGDGEPLYNKELTDDLISGSDCVIILYRAFPDRLWPCLRACFADSRYPQRTFRRNTRWQ
jgi:UDP-N-acetyl-D-glucosamine dehydrogenase